MSPSSMREVGSSPRWAGHRRRDLSRFTPQQGERVSASLGNSPKARAKPLLFAETRLVAERVLQNFIPHAICRCPIAAGKLHKHMTALRKNCELGMFATGQRARPTDQRSCGEMWIVGPGVSPQVLRDKIMP